MESEDKQSSYLFTLSELVAKGFNVELDGGFIYGYLPISKAYGTKGSVLYTEDQSPDDMDKKVFRVYLDALKPKIHFNNEQIDFFINNFIK